MSDLYSSIYEFYKQHHQLSSSSRGARRSSSTTRTFQCPFCHRKFNTAPALGGHQNAQKLERAYARTRTINHNNNGSFHHQHHHIPTNTFPMVPFNCSASYSSTHPDQHVFYNNVAAAAASPTHDQHVDASDHVNLDLTLHL
ncbi:zinc finger protein [Trifolium repens]|jgi:hypothetical protein|nr:zinc finger protein [Trifolium repens]